MDSDTLGPVGVQCDAIFGVLGGKLIRVVDLIAALGCAEPTSENIAGTGGVLNSIKFSVVIVIIGADCTGAGGGLRARVVGIHGDGNRFSTPCGVKIYAITIFISQIFNSILVFIRAVRRAGTGAPTVELITITGKGVRGQNNFLVIGGDGQRYRFAGAVAGVEDDGISDRRPFGSVGHAGADNGVFC